MSLEPRSLGALEEPGSLCILVFESLLQDVIVSGRVVRSQPNVGTGRPHLYNSVQSAMFSVQCAVCSVQCVVCSVQCLVFSV